MSEAGVLMPLDEARADTLAPASESGMSAWEELIRLGKDIGRGWRSPLAGPELLSGMRR